MNPNALASSVGGAVSLAFLWLFLTGIGYPYVVLSLILFLVCVTSAALLFFNSRRWLTLSLGVSLIALVYSALLITSWRGPIEYAAACLAAVYLLASAFAYSRFGKTKYLTPLDMPVYG